MLPGLLGVLGRNERQRRADLQMFELGSVHEWHEGTPTEWPVLAIMLGGSVWPESWLEPRRDATFEDVKGIVESIGARLNIGRVEFGAAPVRAGIDHAGRTAAVVAVSGDERVMLGLCLELDPRLLAAYDVRAEHVAFALLNLVVLERLSNARPQVKGVASLPLVERDIAVIVRGDNPAADVEAVIRRNAGPYLAAVSLFDRYEGPPLDAGELSLAYRLRFQPTDEPLGDSTLDDAINAVTQALEHEVGGRIRSGA
jgi:phenylalanyl-tRNA synthetase beta chain